MKRIAAILIIFLFCMAVFCSCRFNSGVVLPTDEDSTYDYNTSEQEPDISDWSTDSSLTTDAVSTTETEYNPADTTGASQNSVSTTVPVNTTAQSPSTTVQPKPPAEDKTTVDSESVSSMDLSIDMPSANGTMVVDSSSGNKFIKLVNRERKIDAHLLVCVYAVPVSGQNYVFEYYKTDGRQLEDIRRVYLIDEKGEITGVAATNSSERENISSTENWFCMNVLIKGVIYPAVKDEIS